MVIEYEIETKEEDLGSVRHRVSDNLDMSRERKLDWFSNPRPMA